MKTLVSFFVFLFSFTFLSQAQKAVIVESSRSEWTESGVTLGAGDEFVINSYGFVATRNWQMNDPKNWGGPAGSAFTNENADNSCLAPGLKNLALVGKIGKNGRPFYVGEYYLGRADQSGTLYLAYNDQLPSGHGDNFGYFVSFVVIK